MDRKTVRELRPRLEEALEVLAEETGLVITVGSASYSDIGVTFKVSLTEEVAGSEGMPADFQRNARVYGFDPEKLWQMDFGSRGETFTVVGINTRRRKYPISAIRKRDGASFKFPASTIGLLAAKEA